jgi:hypothetical protein
MAIPESVLSLSSVPEIDYVDRFALATDVHASPEQWARAMFGDVPTLGELVIWRAVLGLRLSRRPGPATVAGWRIGGHGANWIRLEAASWFLAANLLVETGGGEVSLVTFVHYRRRPAGAVWPPCSAVHRRLVPRVLRDAEAGIRRGGVR